VIEAFYLASKWAGVDVWFDDVKVFYIQEGNEERFVMLNLEPYFNGRHREYLKDFFDEEIVCIRGIPFQIKLSGLNIIRTVVQGKQSIRSM